MTTQKPQTPKRPHAQYPHFQLVYDLPSPLRTVQTSEEASIYFRKIWPESIDTEVSLTVLMLNAYEQPIAHHTVTLGNPLYQLTALAHYRLIAWITASSCASSVYIAHNVPGQLLINPEVTKELHIIEGLERLSTAMMAMDIELKDHLLISPVDHISLKKVLGNDWYSINEKEAPSE